MSERRLEVFSLEYQSDPAFGLLRIPQYWTTKVSDMVDSPRDQVLDAVIAAFEARKLDLRQVSLEQAKEVTFQILSIWASQQRQRRATMLNQ